MNLCEYSLRCPYFNDSCMNGTHDYKKCVGLVLEDNNKMSMKMKQYLDIMKASNEIIRKSNETVKKAVESVKEAREIVSKVSDDLK